MRILPIALLASLLIISACDTTQTPTVWQATLTGQAGFEAVSGSSTAQVEGGQTIATIQISGAEPGANHPWHIHIGSCETGGPVFDDINAYPILNIGADGSASASATVGAPLDPNVSYFVNVHVSVEDLATIVACGDLSRPGGSGSPSPPGNGDPY